MKKKKAIVGIALGAIMITSAVGAISLPTDPNKVREIEQKREQKLDMIDRASVSWQQGIIDKGQFIAVIDQSIIDTDALLGEYLSLNLSPKYDKYKSLSIDSLNQQKEGFLKLKEYVQTDDPQLAQSIRTEFDQIMIKSFEYRKDALRELDTIQR